MLLDLSTSRSGSQTNLFFINHPLSGILLWQEKNGLSPDSHSDCQGKTPLQERGKEPAEALAALSAMEGIKGAMDSSERGPSERQQARRSVRQRARYVPGTERSSLGLEHCEGGKPVMMW